MSTAHGQPDGPSVGPSAGQPGGAPQGKPGRYDRTTNGLIASMIVTVVVVVLFVGLRTLVYGQAPEFVPENIDFSASVGEAQLSGDTVVYPAALPPGWLTTNFTIDRDRRTTYGFSLLTPEERFVGIQQEVGSTPDLLERLIDEDPVDEERTYSASASIAPEWEIYSDEGGDLAYVADLGEETVVVYGSADAAAMETVVESLTTAPIPR